jgi:peptidoglycan L-alanyl-D-glutamate endopeptidase CwlK
MINSRDLGALRPPVAARAAAFVTACRAAGIEVLITSTLRDGASQAALYAIGRTVKGADASARRPMGRTVTNARPGRSYHNWGCAFDFVPVVHGKAAWNDAALFQRCGAIAESVGLEWAGRWTAFPELAHCQYTGGLSLADLAAGKALP